MPTIVVQLNGETHRIRVSDQEARESPDPRIRKIGADDITDRANHLLASETGALEAAGVAAGETVSNVLEGAGDIIMRQATADVNDDLETLRNPQPEELNSIDALREQRPLATLAGDAAALALIGGPARAAPQIVASGLQGAALASSAGDDPVAGAIEGASLGSLGALAGRFMNRVLSPQANANPTSRRTKRLAKELGIELTAGQRSGSATARKTESNLRSNPAASRSFDELDARNLKTLNRHALETIGEAGDELTDQAINTARLRLNNEFETFGSQIERVNPDAGSFLDDIASIEDFAVQTLDEGQLKLFRRQLDSVLATAVRETDGRAMVALRSQLNKAADRLAAQAGGAGDAVGDLAIAVEKLLFEQSPKKAQAAFAKTRQQWANLRLLRKRNVVIDETLQPARLRQVIQSESENPFRLGQRDDNPLFKIARLQEGVRELVGNSGTATREAKGVSERLLGHTVDAASAALRTNPVTSRVLSNQLGRGVSPTIMLNVGRGGGVAAGENDLEKILLEKLLGRGGVPTRQ